MLYWILCIWLLVCLRSFVFIFFFFSSRRRHTRSDRDWSSDVCSSDLSYGTFFTDYGAGPFASREDMEAWFNGRLIVCQEFGLASQNQPTFDGQFKRLVDRKSVV